MTHSQRLLVAVAVALVAGGCVGDRATGPRPPQNAPQQPGLPMLSRNGILVPPENPAALAKAIEEFFTSGDRDRPPADRVEAGTERPGHNGGDDQPDARQAQGDEHEAGDRAEGEQEHQECVAHSLMS